MKTTLRLGTLLVMAALCLMAHAATPSPEVRASQLVARMSLDEKISQLQSSAPALSRLGIPAYDWWNEGLHGAARGGYATVFPQAIGLAASWDPQLAYRVGQTVASQARARFDAIGAGHDHPRYAGLTLWSPNINIFRDPRWGRGQETYGEDPYLTSQLAVGFVKGIQGDDPDHPKAIATPKHFAVHSGPEAGRHGFDVDVSAHDLEATYLPAFRAAITEGHAGSVMCAYNALHGTPVCANANLLEDTLRKQWGFKGFVVSDCDAIDDMTHFHFFRPDNAGSSAAAMLAGTDLDCGDAYAALGTAVRDGTLPEATLDRALIRLFAVRYRLGDMEPATAGHTRRATPAPDPTLALLAAQESLVLLKNDHGILPLAGLPRLAVIGPNADTVEALEANYHGTALDPVTPLQALRQRLGIERIHYAQGAPVAAQVPVPIPETALRHGHEAGLMGSYYTNTRFEGKPAVTRLDRIVDFDWDHVTPAGLPDGRYAVRWTGQLIPPAPGDYTLVVHVDRCFDCLGHDPVRLYIDDKRVIDDSGNDGHLRASMHLADTAPHALKLEFSHQGDDQGIRLQWIAPADAQLAEAERAVDQADATIAFVGLSPDVEGEELHIDAPGFDGGDRTDIALPAVQQALLERAAARGKPLIVVLMSGSAVALNWARDHASAILAAWYPGQEGGTAIAQALAGDFNPAGRLPVTFYRSVRDLPPFTSYQMQGRTYRYFQGDPLFRFGYGLSYTHFAYASAHLSSRHMNAGQTLMASITVRNTGSRDGDEVAQAYLSYPSEDKLAPRRQLVGMQRIHLKAGQSRQVTFVLDPRRLSSVDADGQRAVIGGQYTLFVGGGQPEDAPGELLTFIVTGKQRLPR
ncbi:glycoside hydrolase family 3 protein [Dyella sp.]|uniref:glycoside hydrolase family 3 protein n=1 Tax=Dyella sp. TaxID=1869338 RepID=UPI0039C88340